VRNLRSIIKMKNLLCMAIERSGNTTQIKRAMESGREQHGIINLQDQD
jgi:hypothetical protein